MDRKRRYFLCLGGAALLVILLAGAGLCLGEMPLRQALDSGILWRLRLPRIATALLAGAALALGGAQMQALFRNPLADPHIMGVSGGAGLGAALAATVTAGEPPSPSREPPSWEPWRHRPLSCLPLRASTRGLPCSFSASCWASS